MSVLEIIIYSLLGTVIVGLLFKWLIYDKFFKKQKTKKAKITKEDEENAEDTDNSSKPEIQNESTKDTKERKL